MRALLAADWVATLEVEAYFKYTPSLAAAAAALALFAFAALVVAVQTELFGWRYMHTVTLTGLCEAAGYACVIYCIKQSGRANLFGPFVAKQLFLLLSPNLLQATAYWTVSNVLAASPGISAGRCCLGKRTVKWSFVGADLFALMVQGGGMGIYATALTSGSGTASQVKLGGIVVLVGLAAQLLFYAIFTWLAVWVHRHPENAMSGSRALTRLYTGLYLNLVFLTVRNVYRFVEFAQITILGYPLPAGAYIIEQQQVLVYCLDAIPVFLCCAAFILFPPGRYLGTISSSVANEAGWPAQGSPKALRQQHQRQQQQFMVVARA
ncbi:hypothetical protein C2E21_5428 [Chlorella sorokiniana]|uniref:RTA1 like n=1 Tax=Chlorella sorokiniana TaxID=3076 RepID=A0A2P6TNL2_CHLSO|nr:hypothetical protein C2E21_5428 [Chlorella sorokiniana]|eukprot:PRW50903.1 hypothetical protein C2E21_5428 [Chlorella sorokiniana]